MIAENLSLELRKDLTPEARQKEVRKAIVGMGALSSKMEVAVAELLCEVRDERYFETYGYTTFDEYVEKEVPFKRRKAFYLMAICDKFIRELQVPVATLENLEWVKAKELKSVVTPENWEKLVARTKTMTVPQIQDMVAKMKGEPVKAKPVMLEAKVEAPQSEPTSDKPQAVEEFKLFLFPEQRKNVQLALAMAKRETESNSAGHLLDVICSDYLASAVHDEDATTALCLRLQNHVLNIERCYKVKLQVVK